MSVAAVLDVEQTLSDKYELYKKRIKDLQKKKIIFLNKFDLGLKI